MKRIVIYFVLGLFATHAIGCASLPPATIVGGECRVFHDPGFAVRGKRLQDSQWIGQTQETGIDVCGWKRPRK